MQRPVGEARLIRLLSEAGVVASEEAGQEAVCRLDVRDAGEGELDDQTVQEGAPEAFDPALCLGGVGGDGHDAELFQRPAELGRLPAALQLLVDGPGSRGVVLEDGMAVVVELQRDAVRPQHLSEEEEVALGVLLLAKECCYHLASGVVNGAEEADLGLVWAQPVVEAAVYLQEHSFLGSAVPMAAMSGWSALVLGLLSRLAAEALHTRPAEDDALVAEEQFLEVAVVAGGIAAGAQLHHLRPKVVAETVGRRSAAVTVHEGPRSLLDESLAQTSDVASGQAQCAGRLLH